MVMSQFLDYNMTGLQYDPYKGKLMQNGRAKTFFFFLTGGYLEENVEPSFCQLRSWETAE